MPAWLDRVLRRSAAPTFSAAAGGATSPPSGGPVGERASARVGRYGYSSSLSRDEAVDATPQSVQQIFDLAAAGKTSRLIDLYKHTRLKDSRLDTVCATRVRAIDGRPWAVKPPPGYESDPAALEVARNVTTILNGTRGLSTLVSHLGHGVLEHLAVLQHRWSRNDRGWWVTQPEWLHPNRFGWRLPDVVPTWADTESGLDDVGKPVAGRALAEWPDRFVVFSPVAGRSDYPWMRGAMRARVAHSVAKRFGFRWWLKMIERWGQPQVYAERSDEMGTSTEVDDEILKALRTLGTDWRATVPKGVELKSIPVQVVTDLHSRFVEHADREDGIAVLGQNLTTEVAKGGSYAAAKAHQSVRLDILAGDLVELGECITDQWIEPLVRFNWPGAPVPYLEFLIGLRDPITVQEFQAGFCDVDTWRGSKGYEPEPDGRGKRYFTGAAPITRTVSGTPAGDPSADPIEVDVTELEQSAGQGEAAPAEAGDVAKEAASNGAVVADLAFNGAQVQALQGMVTAVGVDLAPRAAELIITTAFPSVDEATAREMVGEQQTFSAAKPTASAAPAQSTPAEGT